MISLSLQKRILRLCKPKISMLKQYVRSKKSEPVSIQTGGVSLPRRTGVNYMRRTGVSFTRSSGVCFGGISIRGIPRRSGLCFRQFQEFIDKEYPDGNPESLVDYLLQSSKFKKHIDLLERRMEENQLPPHIIGSDEIELETDFVELLALIAPSNAL